MILNLLYIALAFLGLSFLIFIHELGHYWMARRTGMKVETFSIGFGHPIISWLRDGVRWQIGWLPFGGYVKIAGQEIEKGSDPYANPDGFFGKSPWSRIKVAFMGPLVNIIFAVIAFALLWSLGGREKNFSEFTHKIGWIDPQSTLYAQGIRPGDEIASYAGNPYGGAKDNLYAPMTAGDALDVAGYKVNYATGEKSPFSHKVIPYPHPAAADKGLRTAGVLSTANYVFYNRLPGDKENPLPEGSPLVGSGIEYGDRILWMDGEIVFSMLQLSQMLNDHRALLTVMREGKPILKRVPRVLVQELKLDPAFKEELTDWQYEAQLQQVKLLKLYTIPYNLTNEGVVEQEVKFIDKEKQEEAFPSIVYSDLEAPLKAGDKIIAVDGQPIKKSSELFSKLQQHQVHLIVQRNPAEQDKILWSRADADFDHEIPTEDIANLAAGIGTGKVTTKSGSLYLLKPVTPKMLAEFSLPADKQEELTAEIVRQKKAVESIADPEKKSQALHQLERQQKQLLLGLPAVQDRKVTYNPGAVELFQSVFEEIYRTLKALVFGTMSPKFLSGPLGIVQVVHDHSMVSLKESLFWLGAISLNLGILNLMPIPVLDGGTIVITFIELVTRRRLSPKALERIIIPFAVLLIGLFIFLTYHDLIRIFGGFWR